MSFGLYLVGFAILIAGLAIAASMLGVSGQWIAVGALVLIGIGILSGVSKTRYRDPS